MQIDLTNLVSTGDFAKGNSITVTLPSTGLGANAPNAYFIRMLSTAKQGGVYISFSSRFTLSSMTGVFPATVITGLQAVSGTKGPEPVNQLAGAAAPANPATDQASYEMRYTMQTGAIRYAPMVPVPGTKITAERASALYPTSAYTVFKTWGPSPVVSLTLTQSQTASVASREHHVS